MHRAEAAAERLEQTRDLTVGGQDDRCLRITFEEVPETGEVGFGTSGRGEDRRVGRPLVLIRDEPTQLVGAVRLTVPEQGGPDVDIPARDLDELVDREGVNPALGKVDLDAVLVGGLPPLHLERCVAHGSLRRVFVWTIPRGAGLAARMLRPRSGEVNER